jgi:hypothetical protein
MLSPRLLIPRPPGHPPTQSLFHRTWIKLRLTAQNHALSRFGQETAHVSQCDEEDTAYFVTDFHPWFHKMDYHMMLGTFGPEVIQAERAKFGRIDTERRCKIKVCFRAGTHLADLFTKSSIGKKLEHHLATSQA